MKETLFTVGPVEMFPETLTRGGAQLPYFRTEEFSRIVQECDRDLQALAGAPAGARTAVLTCSGTGAMEATVVNFLAGTDKALILRGGSFGERFCEICADDAIAFDAVEIAPGRALDVGQLEAQNLAGCRALFVNACETSTGALYDLEALGDFCRRHDLYFMVDGISAFLCDPINMEKMGIDALIFSSQKALALPPGLSMIVLSPRLVSRLEGSHPRTHYLGLRRHLADMQRGQTPFTPAVGIILQLHDRLQTLKSIGADASVRRVAALAAHFRNGLGGLPLRIFPERPSNALTALTPLDGSSAYAIYQTLKQKYGLVVTPNGGALRDRVFRVGHMGNIQEHDLDRVLAALQEVMK